MFFACKQAKIFQWTGVSRCAEGVVVAEAREAARQEPLNAAGTQWGPGRARVQRKGSRCSDRRRFLRRRAGAYREDGCLRATLKHGGVGGNLFLHLLKWSWFGLNGHGVNASHHEHRRGFIPPSLTALCMKRTFKKFPSYYVVKDFYSILFQAPTILAPHFVGEPNNGWLQNRKIKAAHQTTWSLSKQPWTR